MNVLKDGWFSEISPANADLHCCNWSGQALSLQVEEVLFQGKSEFQEILVFKRLFYSNLIVDDVSARIMETF